MAIRQVELSPEAEPILASVAAIFGGDESRALSELLVAHDSVKSFLDEIEGAGALDLAHQRDRSAGEFEQGHTVSWEKVKTGNGL